MLFRLELLLDHLLCLNLHLIIPTYLIYLDCRHSLYMIFMIDFLKLIINYLYLLKMIKRYSIYYWCTHIKYWRKTHRLTMKEYYFFILHANLLYLLQILEHFCFYYFKEKIYLSSLCFQYKSIFPTFLSPKTC